MRILTSLKRFTVIARTMRSTHERKLAQSTLQDFEIRSLSRKDLTATMELFQGFATREVPASHLGINSKELMEYLLKPWVETSLLHETSFGAYDKTSGKMVGAGLTVLGTKKRPPPPDLSSDDIPLKIKQLDLLLTSPYPSGPEADLGTSRYSEVFLLYVIDMFANRGLGAELTRVCLERAKELDSEFVVALCSSAFSRKIFEKLDFKVIREVTYEDYVDPITGEKIMRGVDKTHRSAALMAQKL